VDWSNPYEVLSAYKILDLWEPLNPVDALFLLNPKVADEKIRLFAVSRLEKMYDHEFVKYSNQLTQALVSF